MKALSDRTPLNLLPGDLREVVERERLCRDNESSVSYCGVVLCKDVLYVFFPRSVRIDRSNISSFAPTLMKALVKYQRAFDRGVFGQDGGDLVDKGSSLSLISDLLEDYRLNGIYSRRRVYRARNEGKIDWKRTIALESPCFNKSGKPIYMDYQATKKRYQSDCEVARIHSTLICELIDTFGMLFGKFDRPLTSNSNVSLDNKSYCLKSISSELRTAYSDRDIRLLRLMKSFFESKAGKTKSNFLFGLTAFHTAWEYMLSKVLCNTIDISSQLPLPAYRTVKGKQLVAAPKKSGRMDIVLKDPAREHYSVVDAKYYDAKTLATSPGWKDIVKQFFYSKAIKGAIVGSTVNNAFVFPGEDGNWSSIHMKDSKDNSVLDNEYDPINCFYVGALEVMQTFVAGKKLVALSSSILKPPEK